MTNNRAVGRNVHIYNANDRATVIGGLLLNHGVTKANFHSMIEIILIFRDSYSIISEDGTPLERNAEPLQPGNYFVAGRS